MRELDAITDGAPLKTGDMIRVVEIMDDNVLKVEELPTPKDNNNLLFS